MPLVGAYPQARLCFHWGSAPRMAISNTIIKIPSIISNLRARSRPLSWEKTQRPNSAGVPRCLQNYGDAQARARIIRVVEVVAAVGKFDVNVIRVIPTFRPLLVESERIAAVLKTRIAADNHWLTDHENVFSAEIRAIAFVRNASAAARAEPQGRDVVLALHFLRGALRVLLVSGVAVLFLSLLLGRFLLFVARRLFFLH